MTTLLLTALLFVGTHLGLAGTPLRSVLVRRVGETAYLVSYAVISLLTLTWFIDAYKVAPYVETWGQLYALQPIVVVAMLIAFMLAVIGLTTPSPTLVGAQLLLTKEQPARGILRITRHPFLMGVSLWALVHLIVNGDLAALMFFGALLLLCVLGAFSIDAKRQARMGKHWGEFAAVTSVLPFVAVAQGRNRLALAELGAWRVLLSLVGYGAMLAFHSRLFGVSPWLGLG